MIGETLVDCATFIVNSTEDNAGQEYHFRASAPRLAKAYLTMLDDVHRLRKEILSARLPTHEEIYTRLEKITNKAEML